MYRIPTIVSLYNNCMYNGDARLEDDWPNLTEYPNTGRNID